MISPPNVSIIVPTYNGLSYTKMMLKSVQQTIAGLDVEIIFVDNNSQDGTKEFLEALAPSYKVILNPVNRNFAGACNQGAQLARAEVLLFLNNDIVVTSNWLGSMLDVLCTNPSIGVVGNRQLFPNSTTIHHSGILFDEYKHPKHYLEGVDWSDPRTKISREFPAVTGSCFLTRKNIFDELGGFDESYINGYEDIDYCLKVGQKGLKIFYCAESVVFHHTSVSDGRKDHNLPNWQMFYMRWQQTVVPNLQQQVEIDSKLLIAKLNDCKTSTRVALCFSKEAKLNSEVQAGASLFDIELLINFVRNLRSGAIPKSFDKEVLLFIPSNAKNIRAEHWIVEGQDKLADYKVDLLLEFDRSCGVDLNYSNQSSIIPSLPTYSFNLVLKKFNADKVPGQSILVEDCRYLPYQRIADRSAARTELKLSDDCNLVILISSDSYQAVTNAKLILDKIEFDSARQMLFVALVEKETGEIRFGSYKIESSNKIYSGQIIIEPLTRILQGSFAIIEAADDIVFCEDGKIDKTSQAVLRSITHWIKCQPEIRNNLFDSEIRSGAFKEFFKKLENVQNKYINT